jgi:hypothetical protein
MGEGGQADNWFTLLPCHLIGKQKELLVTPTRNQQSSISNQK